MYTKEDIISQRICITGIPDKKEYYKLLDHFFGANAKEAPTHEWVTDIKSLYYRFYPGGNGELSPHFFGLNDYSHEGIPDSIRASKTIDYSEFLYQKYFTKEDILKNRLYIRNIPNTRYLLHLILHMNPRADIPFTILNRNTVLPQNNIYRFFDIGEQNKSGFIEIKEDDDPVVFEYKKIIDFSQFTYGDKYTKEYVQKHRVLIHSIPTEEDFKKLKNYMFENAPQRLQSLLREEPISFNTNDAYRFFHINSGDIIRAAIGHMTYKYPVSLINKYDISTYIPYSAFNYERTKAPEKEEVVKIIKEIPKLSKKWDVVFNNNHCIVNNVKWDNNFMKAMSDLLIRDMFEEMPEFEDNLIKVLEYYELYE